MDDHRQSRRFCQNFRSTSGATFLAKIEAPRGLQDQNTHPFGETTCRVIRRDCLPITKFGAHMSERTASQAKLDNIAAMGDEIGTVYSALWQEVTWIHKKWAQYVELFGTSAERIELLNQAAPSMFRTVQDTLWEDVLLHLARLTDPPKSSGKSNLSVRHLAELVGTSLIGGSVAPLAEATLVSCEFARDWRNRRLAHRDLDLALGQSVQPLAAASRASVKVALAALDELLNSISGHYLDSTTMFDLGPSGEDAVSLLYLLRDGLESRAERLARVKRGEFRANDFKPKPL